MKINEDLIIDDAQKVYNLTDNPSYSKNNKYTSDIAMINRVYKVAYSKYFDLPIVDNPYYNRLYLREYDRDFDEFDSLIYKFKDYYLKIADTGDRIFSENNFFSAVHNYHNMYNDEETKKILLDFFNEEGKYKFVKSMFDEEKIGFVDSLKEMDCSGFCTILHSNIKPYILVEGKNNKVSLLEMYYLAHELGHAVEGHCILNRYNNFYLNKSLVLSEVSSMFYELEFLRYLKEKRINLKDTINLTNEFNMKVLTFLESLKYSDVDKIVNEDDGETYISADDDFYLLDNRNIERKFKNENGDKEGFVEFEFYHPLIYGLGGYIALHLSEIKKQDPKSFNKIWDKYLSMRTLMDYESIIKMFGLNINDFLSGNIIEPTMKEDLESYKKQLKRQL